MDEAQQQQMYDKSWADLLAWAQDKSIKRCEDDGFGQAWGYKLEQVAESSLGRSVLKGVFAWGWRATLPIREDQADRIASLETQLAAANEAVRVATEFYKANSALEEWGPTDGTFRDDMESHNAHVKAAEQAWQTFKDYYNPLARASVEKASKV